MAPSRDDYYSNQQNMQGLVIHIIKLGSLCEYQFFSPPFWVFMRHLNSVIICVLGTTELYCTSQRCSLHHSTEDAWDGMDIVRRNFYF